MNKTPDTVFFIRNGFTNVKSFRGLLKRFFAGKELVDLDVFFRFSNTYHEKLPIIYANIRV
ncbi:MAG TPA: hypothetical protein VF676_10355 [Flavobacterium sp.]|jgi:hypothetical protein